MSVNVSARQLREPGFPDDVAAVLSETGLDARSLTVEVTETAVFESDTAVDALRRISELGVRVALDDFGTGHSSLGLLRSCPVDVLKVDKSFIDGVTGSAEQAAIAISLIQITSTVTIQVVRSDAAPGRCPGVAPRAPHLVKIRAILGLRRRKSGHLRLTSPRSTGSSPRGCRPHHPAVSAAHRWARSWQVTARIWW